LSQQAESTSWPALEEDSAKNTAVASKSDSHQQPQEGKADQAEPAVESQLINIDDPPPQPSQTV